MLSIRTLLHPTDFSKRSDDAFQAACSLARDHGAHLVVLYVQHPDVVYCAEYSAFVPDPIQTLTDVKKTLSARHVVEDSRLDIEYRVAEGDAAAEIIRAARDLPANLIVMGTHGRNGLGRFLMGSVAEAVSRGPLPRADAQGALLRRGRRAGRGRQGNGRGLTAVSRQSPLITIEPAMRSAGVKDETEEAGRRNGHIDAECVAV